MSAFEIGAARGAGGIDPRMTRELSVQGSNRAPVADPSNHARTTPRGMEISRAAVEAGQPPIDSDRVSEIRKAVAAGTYPILPQKIGDAMIAAGAILQAAK